ncbi:MAG: CBS and ACT domain-containing protein [Erysipelotrichaceae bacterium]|nr:CBS and ACT domain-containing protein [Erysipelotrichaceae bacterium]MDY5251532.1 CBS and ACT domain-containing protein [Erysipelotrichaceae bacterium]
MYVKDQMSTNPYCISPKTSISKALEIMSTNDFHRLPVVDGEYNLVGLITAGMISDKTPSKATSLSIYELNYLLSKTNVNEIMETNVKTIRPDALLEEAAVKMRTYDVGCLPVVEGKKVVGIITQNDIFTAFVDLLGYNREGTRYVINIKEDHTGILSDIAKCFTDLGINITNLAVYNNPRGIEVVVIATGDNSNRAKEHLIERGYNVTDVLERG